MILCLIIDKDYRVIFIFTANSPGITILNKFGIEKTPGPSIGTLNTFREGVFQSV